MDTVRKEKKKKVLRWAIISTLLTFGISFFMNLFSKLSLSGSSIYVAVLVLVIIILIGILTDIVGTAVTAADEAPFHSMSSRKVKGASMGITLIRNAERVSNICNDIIGDICGIISGSMSAVIVAILFIDGTKASFWGAIAIASVVASLTVGGKAFGKGIAISKSNDIVFGVAKIFSIFEKDAKNGRKSK